MNEDGNVTVKPTTEEAIGVLATEVVRLTEVLQAKGKLLIDMDARIRALTGLVDHHHAVLTKLAGLPLRPKGDLNVN